MNPKLGLMLRCAHRWLVGVGRTEVPSPAGKGIQMERVVDAAGSSVEALGMPGLVLALRGCACAGAGREEDGLGAWWGERQHTASRGQDPASLLPHEAGRSAHGRDTTEGAWQQGPWSTGSIQGPLRPHPGQMPSQSRDVGHVPKGALPCR